MLTCRRVHTHSLCGNVPPADCEETALGRRQVSGAARESVSRNFVRGEIAWPLTAEFVA